MFSSFPVSWCECLNNRPRAKSLRAIIHQLTHSASATSKVPHQQNARLQQVALPFFLTPLQSDAAPQLVYSKPAACQGEPLAQVGPVGGLTTAPALLVAVGGIVLVGLVPPPTLIPPPPAVPVLLSALLLLSVFWLQTQGCWVYVFELSHVKNAVWYRQQPSPQPALVAHSPVVLIALDITCGFVHSTHGWSSIIPPGPAATEELLGLSGGFCFADRASVTMDARRKKTR
jgi:hypothetical protein